MTVEFDIGALNGTQTFEDFVGNADESDLYRFSLGGVAEFGLFLTGLTQSASVDLYLDENNNGAVDSGESIGGRFSSSGENESLERTLGAGTYLVLVRNSSGSDTRYNLNLSATPTGITDIDASGQAFNAGLLNGTQTFQDFVGNADASDFYRFNLGGVVEFSLLLTGLTQSASVDLYLDENNNGTVDSGESIGGRFSSSGENESLERTLGAGTYLVRVQSSSGSDTRYNLNLSATSIGITDIDGNGQAFNIGLLNGTQIFQDFVGNADGSDFYSFTLSGVTDFSLFLTGLTQSASVDLYLDENNNGSVDSGESIEGRFSSSGEDESLERSLGAGTYLVRVQSSSGSDTRYNLSLFTPLSGSTLISDLNLLNIFGNLVGTAGFGAAGDEFFDLSSGDDTTQLQAGLAEQFRGGVRAFDGSDAITGSPSFDIVNGNQGADILRGGTGADFLRGGRDNDQVFGDDGDDLLNGNIGNDNVDGGTGNDYLRGGQGNDALTGGDGNDFLVGDFGFDLLTGGTGGDTFMFRTDTETTTDVTLADQITDFGTGDRIAIVGNINPNDLIYLDAGGNSVIQLNTGAFLGVVLNTASAAVQSATFVVTSGDPAISLG
ncbi:MAG: calcium-binding protein [Oscillatoria sp. SIO1A7]|nr:calcium-binding protein [Oscillatoria sp. SIO1A7]